MALTLILIGMVVLQCAADCCTSCSRCSYDRSQCGEYTKHGVAFYAYISKDFAISTASSTFAFDVVITNNGNGYTPQTGIFTTPISGVYGFSWTMMAAGTHIAGTKGDYGEIRTHIMQNGIIKGTLHVDTETYGDDASSTGFVILNLNKDDTVKISKAWIGEGSAYSNEQQGRWTFSGFKIA
ncbi:complement C1q tumor necrosis factor-related protein 3-like [Saccostrea cucullata]|uniref:complement C1q tumor necrosis factor-related protein 3-like n=1 Tax=Saccostrea cuccullata TaxID=36930 RepID=UPI002ED0FE7C